MSLRMIFAALMALSLLSSAPAQAQDATAKHSAVRLYSPVLATGDLQKIPAALDITLEGNWKTYWRTPGDAGLAPTIATDGSSNIASVDLHYPAPHRFTIYDIDNFGYKHHVTLPIDIIPATAGAAVDAKLRVDLLVCDDICVPESHTVSLSLPAGTAEASPDAAAYDAALKALPLRDAQGVEFKNAYLATSNDNRVQLVTTAILSQEPGDDADLFVESKGGDVGFGKPTISYDDKTGQATFTAFANSTLTQDKIAEKISAEPLVLTYTNGEMSAEASVKLGSAPVTADIDTTADVDAAEADMPGLSIGIILSALLGGLILNLMPCVLPVLSLKVLSVLSHGGAKTDSASKHKVFVHFMASAAGIISSFWLMAGGLTALKLAGQSIGWGIQFQHTGFLVFLIVIILAFALNMWGLYEIPLPRFIAHRVGRRRDDIEPTVTGDFLTGAFATLLATPCTAPFLGTAVGFALAGSVANIFTIFTFLGLGLAAPYILLALMPGLFKYLPKPGVWMLKLRRVLAIALLATAVWLGSTLYTVNTQPTLDAGWQTFDQSLIEPAVADGKVVFVDITADWCLTCKANKRLVIDTDEVISALNQPHIVRLQGDWTQQDEVIATFLKSYGKFGIPFNIVYGPGAPDGIVLPELLSKRAVLDALVTAAGE